jgi:hypothetical protein
MKKTLNIKIEVETDDNWPPTEEESYIRKLMSQRVEGMIKQIKAGKDGSHIVKGTLEEDGVTESYQYTITEE